jgi:hypothetical protein
MRKDKARDIARGVLPSTARKGARDNKRNFHATHRHAQRQVNHAIERSLTTITDDGTLAHDPDLYDDFEEREVFDGYTASTKKVSLGWDGDMSEIVDRRRGADKLGPLIAWARATEKNKMIGWTNADKMAYFKAVLPDSLQGRHALGHVESALDLEADEFRYGNRYYRNRPADLTCDNVRAGLAKHLSTSKGRTALREFLSETVPVAAHKTETNNKVRTTAPAVDENGEPRYAERRAYYNGAFRTERYRVTVDVLVPQIVSTTCDVCTFLRNDPLATTAAINRFVGIVWAGRPHYGKYYRVKNPVTVEHDFLRQILDYVTDEGV